MELQITQTWHPKVLRMGGQTDAQTDGRPDGRNGPTTRPAFAKATQVKIVSMIRKYHNYKTQTTPWHREEKPLNHHETPGRQMKQNNQLSFRHQDDCITRMDIK